MQRNYLRTSSKKVYQMCLAGKLRCVRIGGAIRIPIDEIERYEAAASNNPVLRGPRMNAAVNTLYAEYLDHTGGDKAAAASLTLAA